MKRLGLTFLLLATLAQPHPMYAEAGTWSIDPNHSSIGFSVRHMMISDVKGTFQTFSGSVVGDPAHPEGAKVSVTIDPSSIDTGASNRDNDLRSPDFFDVEKYPEMKFLSKRIARNRDGKLQITGDLTMHGVTRQVVLMVEEMSQVVRDARGNSRVGVQASTKINRKDFGINWSKTMDGGGFVAGDEVKIELAMEFVKAAGSK